MADKPQPEEPEREFLSLQMEMMISAIMADRATEILDDFDKLGSGEERFKYVWGLSGLHDIVRLEPEFAEKSQSQAEKHRKAGNDYFQKKSYISAVESYNLSIIQAPHVGAEGDASKELALAYGNRSAALLHQKQHQRALADIEAALEEGYPSATHYKLHDRRGKCYVALGQQEEATKSFHAAQESLANSGLDEKSLGSWRSVLDKQLTHCKTMKGNPAKPEPIDVPRVRGEHNEKYAQASSVVDVKFSKHQGRHLVANSDIRNGEVLVVDKPYASVLFPEYQATHCYRCFARTSVPVPCTQCTSVIFCSKECREHAWEAYHQYECRFFILLGKGLCAKVGHLTLRILLVVGLGNILNFLKNRKNSEKSGEVATLETVGIDEAGVYDVGAYATVYDMVHHPKRRSKESLIDFTIIAAFLMKLLQGTSFLKQDDGRFDDEENIFLLGAALERHLQIIQCNASRVQEIADPNNFDNPKSSELGVAIFPTVALANHSCDANCDLVFYGDTAVVRAIRDIYADEEATCCYGALFFEMPVNKRREQLADAYFFDCECQACAEFWPTWEGMEENVICFRCESCRQPLDTSRLEGRKFTRCDKCSHSQNMQHTMGKLEVSHDLFTQGMASCFSGHSNDALPKFIEHLTTMQTLLCQPWRDYSSCQAAVRQCYRMMANRKDVTA